MACAPEIVVAPFEIWWNVLGTAMPDVDDDPAAEGVPWNLVGSLGARRYTEEGVRISWDVETSDVNSVGSIDPECVLPTARNIAVAVTMFDLSLDQLRLAFNLNTVSDVAGPPVTRELSMSIGDLTSFALLVRGEGKSPEPGTTGLGLNMQFEFPNVIEVGAKELAFTKDTPAGVGFEFRVLASTDNKIIAEPAP